HLFKDFLKNKEIYLENTIYWQTIIDKILLPHQIETEIWLETSFANGEPFLDGNPIFHFIVKKQKKAVRIIQEEIENNKVAITAWINNTEFDEIEINELVISLQLSEESKKIALDLIKTWIVNDETVKNTKLKIKEIRLSAEEVLLH
nr:hypothetical protein [Thermoflexibacter sp.]